MTDIIVPGHPTSRHLGRIPDKHRSTDKRFANYLDRKVLRAAVKDRAYSAGIVHPVAPNWAAFPTPNGQRPKPDRDPLGNNIAGDCVLAELGHHVNLIGQQIGDPKLVVTADMVLKEYTKLTGWDPKTGRNDTGLYMRDVIDIAMKEGLFGVKILAACAVNPQDQEEVGLGVWCGCGLAGGYDLPMATETQYDSDGRAFWYVPSEGWEKGDYPGKRGGHCMHMNGTSPAADGFNSWGEDTTSTNAWRRECCSELWLYVIDRWIETTGRAPNGFALQDLLADWGMA